jgi:hypothetical protein
VVPEEIREALEQLRERFEGHRRDEFIVVQDLNIILEILEKIVDSVEAFAELTKDTEVLLVDVSEKLTELLKLVKPAEGTTPAVEAIETLDDKVKAGITNVQAVNPNPPVETPAEKEAKEKAAAEKAQAEKEAAEKALAETKAAEEKAAAEKAAAEKAAQEAREKGEHEAAEKAEKEAAEHAQEEKEASEKATKEATEKAEAEAKAEQEQKEKEAAEAPKAPEGGE